MIDFFKNKGEEGAIALNAQNLNMAMSLAINSCYPIGSIYISINDMNPSEYFGGKWEQIAQGRTLVGVDINDTDFNIAKKTGGSKSLQKHTHKLKNQVLSHGYTSGWDVVSSVEGYWGTDNGNMESTETGTGDSGNLQPYFTCYIWCRIE